MKQHWLAVGVGAVTCAMISGSVLAADLPVSGPSTVIPMPVFSWTGFYIGLHGGWGFGDVGFRKSTVSIADHTMDGGLAGGHIGYNWQMGYSWLVGVEASGTWSGVGKTAIGLQGPLSPFRNDPWTTEVKWLATVTPRIGFTISNWMWYLKGGVAFAGIDHRLTSLVGPVSFDTSNSTVGWTIGFGGELLLASNWVLGIEGNRYDFTPLHADSGIANFPNHDFHVTMWSILGRVSYKFGAPSNPPLVGRY